MGNKEDQKIKKEKVDEETASADFDRFAEAWDLDTYLDKMTPEDADDFKNHQWKIVRQIMNGRASVNEDGNIVYTLFQSFTSITEVIIKRPKGRAYLAMDREKAGRNMAQSVNFIGEAIGVLPGLIKQMDGIDFKFLQSVYMLFLGS